MVMEMLNGLRPELMQTLLEECKSVKVKRLFLFMAEKAEHAWFSDLDLSKISLGTGKRAIVKNTDTAKINIKDNDWVEVFNENGTASCRAIVSQRIPEGALVMYHNQERTVNVPLSNITGNRGGIHNSISRLCPKPTHMIGGYAQLSGAAGH